MGEEKVEVRTSDRGVGLERMLIICEAAMIAKASSERGGGDGK